jgi:xanthine/CO dehydrogenase XdhC/CoxF family maturation factor
VVPIPRDHLERLESQLAEHESWLRTLRLKIEALEAEASAHEMVLRLGRDLDLRRVLDELHDQPNLAERIAKDPRSFLEKRGIEVPDGATVTLTTDAEQSAIEARFDNPPVDYGVGWSRVDGFYLIATPVPPEALSREAG